MTTNWRQGKPLFDSRLSAASRRKIETVAFISPHCLIDFTNGAATATIDQLRVLQDLGFHCEAFCRAQFDSEDCTSIESILDRNGIDYEYAGESIGLAEDFVIQARYKDVTATIFRTVTTDENSESKRFVSACSAFLRMLRPDAVISYGGGPVAMAIQKLVKAFDVPLIFALHNFGYGNPESFLAADYVVVPTEYCRQFYWDTLGLACQKLPLVINPDRVEAGSRRPGYITFVNPETRKGVFIFARIAEILAKSRPDISFLIVDGKQRAARLSELGIDLSDLNNITVMENTADPRSFFEITKILLMPSLAENAGLVASEAMMNGIPVLASNRGGLPEAIGDAGFLFEIPACYTSESREMPTAQEVEPWIRTIEQLWDNATEYGRWSQAARERARLWHPDSLASVYREFFANITRQPGPPLMPRKSAASGTTPSGCNDSLRDATFFGGFSIQNSNHARFRSDLAVNPAFVTCKWLGKSGRLGNQLFQIAATIGIARKNELEYVFPPWNYATSFQKLIPQLNNIPDTEVYWEASFGYNDICTSKSTDIAGCFQSERYFKHCEAEVRSYFAPRPELMELLERRHEGLLQLPTCSVHVRRGDYLNLPTYVDLAATGYYESAFDHFPADTTFVLFSDNIGWCQERFRGRRFVFVEGQSELEDLFLMSLCDDHIIANSTFSWWGAWLDRRKRKKVIAPVQWFAGTYADPSLPFSCCPYQGYHESRDIVPPDWIPV